MKPISIDNEFPDENQAKEIMESCCINCGEFPKETDKIIFVETDSGMKWWHGKKSLRSKIACKYKSIYNK